MKTCSLYGFAIAIASMFLTLVVYFIGWHSDPEKLTLAAWAGGIPGLAILVIGLVLAAKARRSEIPANEAFGYGRSLGTAYLTALISAVLFAVFYYVYLKYINAGLGDMMLQAQAMKMEEKGLSSDQVDHFRSAAQAWYRPGAMVTMQLVSGAFINLIIALIVAAFVRRDAKTDVPPPLQG